MQGDFSIGNEARAPGGSSEVFLGSIDEVRISSIARGPDGFFFPGSDSDHDDLPDTWEMAWFNSISGNASANPDHDSWTNLMEYAFDANPASSMQDGRYSLDPSGTSMVLTFPVIQGAVSSGTAPVTLQTEGGLVYRVEASDDLLDWSLPVAELTGLPAAAIRADLPRLSEGWEYRSFRIPMDSQGFLRAGITGAPEP